MKFLEFICGALIILSFLAIVIVGVYLSVIGIQALFVLGGVCTWIAIGIISFVVCVVMSTLWKIYFEG